MTVEILIAATLIGLAAFRAWRVIGADTITEPIRFKLSEAPGRFWRWVYDGVTCAWCLGFWLSGAGAALVAWFYRWDWLQFGLVWLAASALCGALGKLDELGDPT